MIKKYGLRLLFVLALGLCGAVAAVQLGVIVLRWQDNMTVTQRVQPGERAYELLRAWIASAGAEDFAGAAERVISTPRWQGKVMAGEDYFVEHALPNFYFHTATAYSILRHNGVPLGKRDFLGPQSLRDPS